MFVHARCLSSSARFVRDSRRAAKEHKNLLHIDTVEKHLRAVDVKNKPEVMKFHWFQKAVWMDDQPVYTAEELRDLTIEYMSRNGRPAFAARCTPSACFDTASMLTRALRTRRRDHGSAGGRAVWGNHHQKVHKHVHTYESFDGGCVFQRAPSASSVGMQRWEVHAEGGAGGSSGPASSCAARKFRQMRSLGQGCDQNAINSLLLRCAMHAGCAARVCRKSVSRSILG